jgi:preprotein translocase subunit SecE
MEVRKYFSNTKAKTILFMSIKQGEENTKFIKEENDPTRKYIFQENKKTKLAASIVTVILVLILIGIIISGVLLDS